MGFGFPAKLKHMEEVSHIVGVCVSWLLVLIRVLWATDVFCREIAERTTRIMYWIQATCFIKKS
jgi:TRAP-type mannitol/chloroaromatic compound transport system permease small subunit